VTYTPKYTSESKIEALVGFDITAKTKPSSSQVLDVIEEVEAEIDAKYLGWEDGASYGEGYTISDLYIDVPASAENIEENHLDIITGRTVDTVYLSGYPIIEMTKLYRRTTASAYDSPEWEELNQGYYSGWTPSDSHYKLITTKGKDGQSYGIGFCFYGDKRPYEGPASLKAIFKCGYLIPEEIVQEYATLKCAIKVLQMATNAGEPVRFPSYPGGSLEEYVPRELNNMIREFRERIKEIEKMHLPDRPAGPIMF